jgi:hypothetical protein
VWGSRASKPPAYPVKRDTGTQIELESQGGFRYRECIDSYKFI